ncbi:DUF4212 domain-containing protein [Melaminivora suipulveris]|uniref:DUF4212 domain-containing protein n=1 Tax=Melaminivora suipulveris TaxID=2109913 RepID=A0A2R3QF44_9BURK|nr:DUF4212 domain-containing protein [Melaminivora suipulveris]AVO50327.1 DUF4212 domain-containing protein [Melaminivora suipulveris]
MPPHSTLSMEPEHGEALFAPDLHDVRHLWLKGVLLAAWALVSFVASYFARELQFGAAGWSPGYWLASQGAVLIFIAIVWIYCLAMNRFEREDAAAQPHGAPPDA